MQLLYEPYNVCSADWIFVSIIRQVSAHFPVNLMKFILISIYACVFELVMIRGVCVLSSDVHFKRSDVYGAITFLCVHYSLSVIFIL